MKWQYIFYWFRMCKSELMNELAFKIISEQTVLSAKSNGKELAALYILPMYPFPTKNSSSEKMFEMKLLN